MIIKNEIKHTSKSFLFKERSFLLTFLVMYIGYTIIADYGANILGVKIDQMTSDLVRSGTLGFVVNRILLWEIIIQIGFFGIIVGAFARFPHLFFKFNGYEKYEGENPWIIIFRAIGACIVTSFVLMLLFGMIQGFAPGVYSPDYLLRIFLNYKFDEATILNGNPASSQWIRDELYDPNKLFVTSHQVFDYYLGWTRAINFSLIFLFIIRIGIFTTLIGEFLETTKFGKVNSAKIVLVLLVIISSICINWKKLSEYQRPKLQPKTIENLVKEILPPPLEDPESDEYRVKEMDKAFGRIEQKHKEHKEEMKELSNQWSNEKKVRDKKLKEEWDRDTEKRYQERNKIMEEQIRKFQK